MIDLPTAEELVKRLVEEHGDRAYDEAVETTAMALRFGDSAFARVSAEAGRELLRRGYHKRADSAKEKA